MSGIAFLAGLLIGAWLHQQGWINFREPKKRILSNCPDCGAIVEFRIARNNEA